MDNKIRLYPPVEVKRQSFKNVKRCVVPNQSLSLREIVKRFVRHESLPLHKEGLYEERFGDLEKLKVADVTVQMERVDEIKSQIASWNKRVKEAADRKAKIKADMDAAARVPIVPPVGGTPVNSPPLQGS